MLHARKGVITLSFKGLANVTDPTNTIISLDQSREQTHLFSPDSNGLHCYLRQGLSYRGV